MVLAYDYPLLGMFWTFLLFFIWIAWIVVLFRVIFDIFRSKDLGGFAKALWVIFVILLPFLGVLVYLIARGHSMTERDYQEAQVPGAGVPGLCAQRRRRPAADRPTNSPSSPTCATRASSPTPSSRPQKAKLLA